MPPACSRCAQRQAHGPCSADDTCTAKRNQRSRPHWGVCREVHLRLYRRRRTPSAHTLRSPGDADLYHHPTNPCAQGEPASARIVSPACTPPRECHGRPGAGSTCIVRTAPALAPRTLLNGAPIGHQACRGRSNLRSQLRSSATFASFTFDPHFARSRTTIGVPTTPPSAPGVGRPPGRLSLARLTSGTGHRARLSDQGSPPPGGGAS